MRLLKWLVIVLFFTPYLIYAGTITKPHTFTSGTTIVSADVNEDFDTIYSEFNGGIDTANIEAGGVGTTDIADGAVTDTKITTGVANAKISFTTDQTLAGEQTFSDTCNFNDDTVFDSTKSHGLDSYVAPTDDADFAPKKYVDDTGSVVDHTSLDSAVSTTSGTTVDMVGATITKTTVAGNIFVIFERCQFYCGATDVIVIQLLVDDVVKETRTISSTETYPYNSFVMTYSGAVTAAEHVIHMQWYSASSTLIQASGAGELTLISGLN